MKQLSESRPASRKFEYSKQTNASKHRQSFNLFNLYVGDAYDDKVNERNDCNQRIEDVERVSSVFFETQADQLNDHLCYEEPDHYCIDLLSNLLTLKIYRVLVEAKHDCVEDYEDSDEGCEQKMCAHYVA